MRAVGGCEVSIQYTCGIHTDEDRQRCQLGATQCISLSSTGAEPFPAGSEVPIPWLLHQSAWNGSFPFLQGEYILMNMFFELSFGISSEILTGALGLGSVSLKVQTV